MQGLKSKDPWLLRYRDEAWSPRYPHSKVSLLLWHRLPCRLPSLVANVKHCCLGKYSFEMNWRTCHINQSVAFLVTWPNAVCPSCASAWLTQLTGRRRGRAMRWAYLLQSLWKPRNPHHIQLNPHVYVWDYIKCHLPNHLPCYKLRRHQQCCNTKELCCLLVWY